MGFCVKLGLWVFARRIRRNFLSRAGYEGPRKTYIYRVPKGFIHYEGLGFRASLATQTPQRLDTLP